MSSNWAHRVYDTLNNEQKQLFQDLVNRYNSDCDSVGDNPFIQAVELSDRIRVKMRGSNNELGQAITALAEGIADSASIDFEEIIGTMRYIHYSKLLKLSDTDEF